MYMAKITSLTIFLASVLGSFIIPSRNTHVPGNALKVTLDVQYDSTGVKPGRDTIVYTKNKTVNWNDFKGPVPANFPAVANSAVGFMYRAGMISEGRDLKISIRITAFFIRPQSWVKEKDKSDYILEHEQRHFDLARYGAEQFRQKLLAASFNDTRVGAIINKAYQDAWTEYQALQVQYDEETEHSINMARQNNWNDKITGWLARIP